MWLNKEKLAKITSIYQNLIVYSWVPISFKKKAENTLKSSSIFIFITMAHTAQNNSLKIKNKKINPTNYEL